MNPKFNKYLEGKEDIKNPRKHKAELDVAKPHREHLFGYTDGPKTRVHLMGSKQVRICN